MLPGKDGGERKRSGLTLSLTALAAALMVFAAVETVAIAAPIEFGSTDDRFGGLSTRQVVLGGLLFLGPLQVEWFVRD